MTRQGLNTIENLVIASTQPFGPGPVSYRASLAQNASAIGFRQRERGEHVDRDAHEVFEAPLDAGEVHETRFRGGIDEEIEVAAFGVFAVENRSEDTRIAAPMIGDDAANFFAMARQGFGRSHSKDSIENARLGEGLRMIPRSGLSTVFPFYGMRLATFAPRGRDVVEADEVDGLAAAVLCDFEEVEDAEEAGGAGELGRDVGEADVFDGIDLDFAFFHAVAAADFDVGTHPDADARGDFAAADAVAEAFGEEHGERIAVRLAQSLRAQSKEGCVAFVGSILAVAD